MCLSAFAHDSIQDFETSFASGNNLAKLHVASVHLRKARTAALSEYVRRASTASRRAATCLPAAHPHNNLTLTDRPNHTASPLFISLRSRCSHV